MIIPEINRNCPSAHSHPPPDDTVVEQIFRQNILAKISKNPVGPLRKSYDEEVENIPETVNFIPPSYNKIRPSLFRKRQNILPKDPKTFDEVNIQGPRALTSDGKQFLLHQEPKMTTFATKQGIEFLLRSKRFLSDGTFKTAPHLSNKIIQFLDRQTNGKSQSFGDCSVKKVKQYMNCFSVLSTKNINYFSSAN